jgi:hypothetical protein
MLKVKKFACLRTVPSPSRWKKRSPDAVSYSAASPSIWR